MCVSYVDDIQLKNKLTNSRFSRESKIHCRPLVISSSSTSHASKQIYKEKSTLFITRHRGNITEQNDSTTTNRTSSVDLVSQVRAHLGLGLTSHLLTHGFHPQTCRSRWRASRGLAGDGGKQMATVTWWHQTTTASVQRRFVFPKHPNTGHMRRSK